MRIRHMETLSDDTSDPDSILMLEQRFSHSRRRIRAGALALAGALLCAPFVLVLTNQMARAQLVELGSTDPLVAIKLGFAAAIGLAALYCGLADLLRRVVRRRIVKIDREQAIVEDVVRGRKRLWREPLHGYNGIRHQVQTRSSGPIHILMLEHARSARTLCIAYETHLADQLIIDAGRRYNLPVLSVRRDGFFGRLVSMLPKFPVPWVRSDAPAVGT